MSKRSGDAQLKYILERNSNSTIFAFYAQRLLNKHQLFEALTIAKRGVIANPTYVMGHIILAQAHLAEQDFRQALIELTTALRLEPTNIKALSMVASILEKEDEKEASLQVYSLMAKINPALKVLRHKNIDDVPLVSLETILNGIGTKHEKVVHEEIPYEAASLDGINLHPEEHEDLTLTATDSVLPLPTQEPAETQDEEPAMFTADEATVEFTLPSKEEENEMPESIIDEQLSSPEMLSATDATVEFTLPIEESTPNPTSEEEGSLVATIIEENTPSTEQDTPSESTPSSNSDESLAFDINDLTLDEIEAEDNEEDDVAFSDAHLEELIQAPLKTSESSTNETDQANPFEDFRQSMSDSLTVLDTPQEETSLPQETKDEPVEDIFSTSSPTSEPLDLTTNEPEELLVEPSAVDGTEHDTASATAEFVLSSSEGTLTSHDTSLEAFDSFKEELSNGLTALPQQQEESSTPSTPSTPPPVDDIVQAKDIISDGDYHDEKTVAMDAPIFADTTPPLVPQEPVQMPPSAPLEPVTPAVTNETNVEELLDDVGNAFDALMSNDPEATITLYTSENYNTSTTTEESYAETLPTTEEQGEGTSNIENFLNEEDQISSLSDTPQASFTEPAMVGQEALDSLLEDLNTDTPLESTLTESDEEIGELPFDEVIVSNDPIDTTLEANTFDAAELTATDLTAPSSSEEEISATLDEDLLNALSQEESLVLPDEDLHISDTIIGDLPFEASSIDDTFESPLEATTQPVAEPIGMEEARDISFALDDIEESPTTDTQTNESITDEIDTSLQDMFDTPSPSEAPQDEPSPQKEPISVESLLNQDKIKVLSDEELALIEELLIKERSLRQKNAPEESRNREDLLAENSEEVDQLTDTFSADLMAAGLEDEDLDEEEPVEEIRPLSTDALPEHVITPTYGDLYLQQDQPEMAHSIYEKIVEQNPDDDEAQQKLQQIKEHLEKNDTKKELLEKPLAGKKIKKEIREKLSKKRSNNE